MLHADLVKAIASKTELTQVKVEAVLEALVEEIKGTLKTEKKIKVKWLWKFEVKDVAARMGVNPKTWEKIKIAAKTKVKATADKELLA